MKLASYIYEGIAAWGVVDEEGQVVYPAKSIWGDDCPDTLLAMVQQHSVHTFPMDLIQSKAGLNLQSVELCAPFPQPLRNVYCVGKNYMEHIKELATAEAAVNERPIFFSKSTGSVSGPYDAIPRHAGITSMIDYEAELAVIIGKEGINITEESAHEHIFGYSVLNDVTARDLQRSHRQWVKGKGLDGFCPMGPWIVTKDEISNPQNLTVASYVNDQVRQNGNTQDMIYNIAVLISQLSEGMTLYPGDIIATGTPKGVGMGMKPPVFLQSGDTVRVVVEGIGEIFNTVE